MGGGPGPGLRPGRYLGFHGGTDGAGSGEKEPEACRWGDAGIPGAGQGPLSSLFLPRERSSQPTETTTWTPCPLWP